MPTVNIGSTSKRVNSISKIFSGGASLNCRLKEPCSMQTPVFIVQGLSKGTFYNYCSFEGRYYWVDDIVYLTNNLQEVHCHLDPLATYADAIKNSTAFVAYGDAGHWNEYMDDVRMQPEEESASITATHGNIPNISWSGDNGTIIMTAMSCADTSYGVNTYALTVSQFNAMCCDLASVLVGSSSTWVGDVAKDLANVLSQVGGLGSWRDNILSAKYIPISTSSYPGTSTEIVLGGVKTGHYGKKISTSYIQHGMLTVAMPWGSDALQYKFLRNTRWASMQVQTWGGFAEVDLTYLRDQTGSCGLDYAIDLVSGEWAMYARANAIGTGLIIGGWSGNIGTDIIGAVGKSNSSYTAFMHKTAELTAKVYSMGATSMFGSESNGEDDTSSKDNDVKKTSSFSAAIGSGIGGAFAQSGVSSGAASGQIGGGLPGLFLGNSGYNGEIVFKMMQLLPKDLANYTAYCDKYGYPCNQYLTLSSISGFCQCVGASVQGATGASQASLSTINSYLNSGIYIEA